MEAERSRKRRRYSAELKAQILAECAVLGASVAKVALSHGINANIVHGWRKQARGGEVAPPVLRQGFVPVTIAPAVHAGTDERGIEVELRRGAVTIKLLWLLLQRQKVPDGSATAKAIDYSLKRWEALMRYIDDGELPIDNNWVENQIRPIALGRQNWLFAGSLRAGKRAAAVMSLIHSARLNGHDPYTYVRDVLEQLPTHAASRIEELLPHRWTSAAGPH